jgi:prolyl-tRNA editing enzyme YbaK/EbsC (Cys-tRNA(Pro) deacylase)
MTVDIGKLTFVPAGYYAACVDTAVSLTDMDYGGITPIGLPADCPILVDSNVVDQQRVIIDRAPKCWRSPLTPRRRTVALP